MTKMERPSVWPPETHDAWEWWDMSRIDLVKALGRVRGIVETKNRDSNKEQQQQQ